MFLGVHVTHWLLRQYNTINTIFNPSSVMYIIAQMNFSTIANICWLIQTFKNQCCGFQVHFKLKLEHNLKTKRDFWSKCPHYIMGYIINLGSMSFIFSLVSNLAYIDYSLWQIWSVYMQYIRRHYHSNNCLFLVIQQAEVLLNFFGGCICCILFASFEWYLTWLKQFILPFSIDALLNLSNNYTCAMIPLMRTVW